MLQTPSVNVTNSSSEADNGPQCAHTFPLITPSTGGSTVFVYHGAAVAQYRELVLTPFFVGLNGVGGNLTASNVTAESLDLDEFQAEVTRLGTAHLVATLDILSPANQVNVYSANYQVSY